jgi:hypothetical protein
MEWGNSLLPKLILWLLALLSARFVAEIIHETSCFAIRQKPLAQLSLRVCPTTCCLNKSYDGFMRSKHVLGQ